MCRYICSSNNTVLFLAPMGLLMTINLSPKSPGAVSVALTGIYMVGTWLRYAIFQLLSSLISNAYMRGSASLCQC